MKFDSVIEERHSTRSFKDKPVDFRDIMAAIDAALQGPFAGNLNDMQFLIPIFHQILLLIQSLTTSSVQELAAN